MEAHDFSHVRLHVTDQLSEDLMNFCLDIADVTIPLLIDKEDHDINEYEEAITQVYNSLV